MDEKTQGEFTKKFGFPPPSEEEGTKFGAILDEKVQTVCSRKYQEFKLALTGGRENLGIPEEKERELLSLFDRLNRFWRDYQDLLELAKQAGFTPPRHQPD